MRHTEDPNISVGAGSLTPACRTRRARPWFQGSERVDDEQISGTTMPLTHVLKALLTCLLLSLLMDAHGLVHAAQGMPDGRERSLALGMGNLAASVGDAVGLTWAWDRLAAAHGYHPQPALPPLLASVPRRPPRSMGAARVSSPISPVASAAPRRTATSVQRRRHPARVPFRPTPAHPLRLLVTGDSLTDYLGPDLVDMAYRSGPVRGSTDSHDGTGLVRPDYVDWSLVARQQVAARHPQAVVVMLGGNDDQNMVVAGGRVVLAGSPEWKGEYARRAAVCMRIWTQGGKARVYWLSMPPARDEGWTRVNMQIDSALRKAAARVPGVRYLDILGPVTDHGRYAEAVVYHGQTILVRAPDGIHFNIAGSQIIADEVMTVLRRDWRLGR